jgi:hypothetical protein
MQATSRVPVGDWEMKLSRPQMRKFKKKNNKKTWPCRLIEGLSVLINGKLQGDFPVNLNTRANLSNTSIY